MKVVILAGISGSGKSSLAAERWPNAVVCSADHWFNAPGGEYHFDPAQLPQAHAACLRRFVRALLDREPVIVVDNTNTTVAEITPYAALAQAYEAELEIVLICGQSLQACAARNVHGVPLKTIAAQAERLAQLDIPPWWKVTRIM
jgi:predicted kinase